MSLYPEIMPQLIKMLGNLNSWLDEAEAYATERDFDAERFLTARLYPDMFPLTSQIQAACDAAKFVGSRLSGTEAPKNPDTETTLAELRTRIAGTIAFLEGIEPSAFTVAPDAELKLKMLQGGSITAEDYLREFAIPNFYFHASQSYALLRMQGVKLGKRKFLGSMNVKMPG